MLDDAAWAAKYAGCQPRSLRSLVLAIANHQAMAIYIMGAAVALAVTLARGHAALYVTQAIGITVVCYPLAEYALHRYVLHARGLWRIKLTAWLWRRLHYDHHMDPKDMTVLFAPPVVSIPFLLGLCGLAATTMGEAGLFPAMVFASFCAFAYYETMHAASHLGPRTANKWLARRCRNHLRHHYLQEMANFGIGSGLLDRLCYQSPAARGRSKLSPTVRNLGYSGELAARYPWAAKSYARKRAALALQSNTHGTATPPSSLDDAAGRTSSDG
jgi:hypothetical protein